MTYEYSVLEMIIYSLLNFVPYAFVAIYPFRSRLRFSKKITVSLFIAVSVVQVIMGLIAGFVVEGSTSIISIISTVIYVLFYFLCIKEKIGKLLFILLMLSNISNLVVSMAKCLENLVFPDLAPQIYRWSFSLATIFVQIIILVPIFLFITKIFSELLLQQDQNFLWHFLWLIPSTFYLIWYYNIYFNSPLSSLEIALSVKHTAISLFINLGAVLIYHVIAMMLSENRKNIQLENANHSLQMETLQYQTIQDKIEETRKARHDFRHHTAVINSFIEHNDFDSLKEYFNSFVHTLPSDSPLKFSDNTVINILTSHFYEMAINNNIKFNAEINIPKSLPIKEIDLTVILGNLLENAVTACMTQTSSPKEIQMHCTLENECFIFIIDNTFDNVIRKNSDGQYLSTKHAGTGIGIESVSQIIERYNGIFKVEQKNNMFCVSVMIQLS